jgi:hypothetical protein
MIYDELLLVRLSIPLCHFDTGGLETPGLVSFLNWQHFKCVVKDLLEKFSIVSLFTSLTEDK